jgi:hypothetical protein
MNIALDLTVKTINELKPGAFFVSRTHEVSFAGIAAVYGGSPAAVLLNLAVTKDEPVPCLAYANFIGGQGLIEIADAILKPDLTEESLNLRSEVADGPGALFVDRNQLFMRVTRRGEGFVYVNVASGVVDQNRPTGAIEIPRWSIVCQDKILFKFDGPKSQTPNT